MLAANKVCLSNSSLANEEPPALIAEKIMESSLKSVFFNYTFTPLLNVQV